MPTKREDHLAEIENGELKEMIMLTLRYASGGTEKTNPSGRDRHWRKVPRRSVKRRSGIENPSTDLVRDATQGQVQIRICPWGIHLEHPATRSRSPGPKVRHSSALANDDFQCCCAKATNREASTVSGHSSMLFFSPQKHTRHG